jgi:First Longin domain of FUZ, MON1 and HPS1/Second Longin domain of FUZ, MON1 and HPS1
LNCQLPYVIPKLANRVRDPFPRFSIQLGDRNMETSSSESSAGQALASLSKYATTQILIMSEAGKPIFTSSGDAESLSKTCGLIQAIRTSVFDQKSNLGDLQTLKTNQKTMVFMSVGSITLVAISTTQATEAHLKLQLEYMYSRIIFTMTNQVQNVFAQSPGYDLDIGESAFQHIVNDASRKSPPNYLTGGANVIGPISFKTREMCSKVLRIVGSKSPNTVFALLLVGNQLLTIVQPSYVPHQLKSSDLRLIVQFVHHQPGVLTSELWFPVCLPRFNASGFLYVYTNCFDKDKKLTLVLMSQLNTPDQFEVFRRASSRIRHELDIPQEQGSILRIMERPESQRASRFDDVSWQRSTSSFTALGDDVSSQHASRKVDVSAETPGDVSSTDSCVVVKELRNALDENAMVSRMQEYCDCAEAVHFCFRVDVPVVKSNGKLTQCISAPLSDVLLFVDEASKQRVWNMYQRLCLRMRMGTCTAEATLDAFDVAPVDDSDAAGIQCCPAMRMTETPPNVHGISYILDGPELFLAMNGRDFELYLVFSSIVPVKKAASLGAKLARRLFADEKKLFLMTPLVWKD